MRRVNLMPLAAAALLSPCLARPTDPLVCRDVETGRRTQDEIIAVVLDDLVYAGTGNGFPDLRVLEVGGTATPYLLEQQLTLKTKTERRTVGSSVVSLRELPGNRIEIIVALDRDADSADGLTFSTPLRDFERRVTVFGEMANGDEWQPLATDALLFDYTRYMDISNTRVRLATNTCRRFRVVVEEVTDRTESPSMSLLRRYSATQMTGRTEQTTVRRRPFRVNSITCWHAYPTTEERVRVEADYIVPELTTEEDTDRKRTIVSIRSQREPLTELTLKTSSRNFRRRASVQVPVDRGVRREWVEVGSGQIHAIRFRSYLHDRLAVTFPEQRQTEYRLVIENHDGPPLSVDGVTASGNSYRLLFLAPPEQSHRVRYGGLSDEPPKYDTQAIRSLLTEGYEPLPAGLGPESPLETPARGPGRMLRDAIESRVFFGAAICLMVVMLGWGLLRSGRALDRAEEA